MTIFTSKEEDVRCSGIVSVRTVVTEMTSTKDIERTVTSSTNIVITGTSTKDVDITVEQANGGSNNFSSYSNNIEQMFKNIVVSSEKTTDTSEIRIRIISCSWSTSSA